MGAKSIIHRYLDRNRSSLPNDPLKLREALLSAAEKSRLAITVEELDELVPLPTPRPPKGGEKEAAPKKAKTAPKTKAKKKTGHSTK